MISELERINALNLEPSLPKVDDGNRSVSRYSQDRDKVKNEFQQFLTTMKQNDSKKGGAETVNSRGSDAPMAAMPKSGAAPATSSVPNLTLQPAFIVENPGQNPKNLQGILEDMLGQAESESKRQESNKAWDGWPEAKGPSYHDVLGRPTGQKPELPAQAGQQPQAPADAGNRSGGHMPQNNNSRQPNQDQGQQMRQNNMGQNNMQGPPAGMQQQPGGYMMAPQGGQQGGQPQMQMFVPGPQGMQPMSGMPMQGMQFMVPQGQQGMMPMMGGQPNQQPGMMPMMMAPQQGGQNPQGMAMPGGMPQFDANGQQQQQMMFMPVMMAQDQNGNMMMPQGMQGYPQQGGGPQGGPQQGGYMMQQPMFQPQANNG